MIRTQFLQATLIVSFVLACTSGASSSELSQQSPPAPELVLEITCDIAPTMTLGVSPIGERRVVPIIGGTFEGRGLSGTVLAGGVDRQLVRPDGFKQLSAAYELKTNDGSVISVSNHVLMPPKHVKGRRVFSNIELIAPVGKYDWINQHVFIGTLDVLMPERNAVVIKVYQLN